MALYSLGILEYNSIIAYGGGLTLPIDILFYALAYQSQLMEKKSLETFNAQAEQVKQKKKAALMDIDFHAMTPAPAIRRSLLKEKSYLNPQVKLEELAYSTGINRNYLSAYFNQHLKITYPEAINELRVRHIRKQIKRGNSGRLLDLALEAGFDSKATFNRVFKKLTGLTPTEYIKTKHPNQKETA